MAVVLLAQHITGKQKFGKSALALQICKNAQQVPTSDGSPRKVFWLDVEQKLEPKDVKYVNGLKTGPEHFAKITSTKDKILTAEDYLNIAESLIRGKPESVIVIDSLSD